MLRVWKRVLPACLSLALIFGLFVGGPFMFSAQGATIQEDGFVAIETAAEFDAMLRENLGGNYRLIADIDLTTYPYNGSTWTERNRWDAIGSFTRPFTGVLDGNGHKVTGLWSKDRGSNQGLFGSLSGATVKNLTLALASGGITGDGERKGGLAGNAYNNSLIENSHVIGSGTSGSPITGGANYIAGLVGVVNSSTVRGSSAENLQISGSSYVAGLIGVAYRDTVRDAQSVISDSFATGTITKATSYAGGFIGQAYAQSIIQNSYATGDVKEVSANYSGGFAGAISGQSSVSNSYATGSVTERASYAGGFAGVIYEASSIYRSFAFGDVSANYYAGGFVGTIYDGSVMREVCAYGNVQTNQYIAGGLAGEVVGATIENAYAQGNVSGTTGVGGLVGYFSGSGNTQNKSVLNAYSSGTVSTTAGTQTEYGAFSGRSGVEFRGTNYVDISKNPSTPLYGTAGTPIGDAGAFPQGKDTETMMKQETFVGWNFYTIWGIDENETYPYFVWMPGKAKPAVPVIVKSSENLSRQDGNTHVGDTIQYTVTVKNDSAQSTIWANAEMADTLPEGLELIEGSVQLNGETAAYDYADRTLRVALGDIVGGETRIVTFQATVDLKAFGKDITNSVSVWGKDGEEDKGGETTEDKDRVVKNRTVTGLVTPLYINELGLADDLASGYDTIVELRSTFDTEAPTALRTTVNLLDNSGLGRFTIEEVPAGEYVLYIKKPGYLARAMDVLITQDSEAIVELTPPDGATAFDLWWGDADGTGLVDQSDVMMLLEELSLAPTVEDPGFSMACDMNGDGIIDISDIMMILENINLSILDYPGAETVFQ